MLEGFELWVPPTPPTYDEDGLPYYEIIGTDAQIVQFPVRAGRKVMCFSGGMAYMSESMEMESKLAGFGKTFGRMAGGGSLFQIIYTNKDTFKDGYIGMTPDYPGIIIPINMSVTGKVVALRDSFLCATVGIGNSMTDVGAGFNPASNALAFCCSGMDCALLLLLSLLLLWLFCPIFVLWWLLRSVSMLNFRWPSWGCELDFFLYLSLEDYIIMKLK
jgi:hypothetical protein